MNLYLDHNATAPLSASAKKAMVEGMNFLGNASSVHQFGRQVRQKIEQTRQEIADYFSVIPANVVFTSGATESNNLALCGFDGTVIISAIEHDSIDQARPDRQVCPVHSDCVIDLKALEKLIEQSAKPVLISVMAANNETGVIQPLEAIVDIAQKYGAYVHCDAVQAVGRIDLNYQGIDLISVSAHKLGGPQGVGALIINSGIRLVPQLKGGGQERSIRSGTENFLGILGFGAAIREAQSQNWAPIETLRDSLEARLKLDCPDAIFLAREAPRLPNTTVIAMKGVPGATQVMAFDLAGIALSAGSACSSGKVKPSRVLRAMNIPEELVDCAIRVSLGLTTLPEHIDQFVDAWANIYAQAKQGRK